MIIAVANQKGGVGKTTTTENLGVALSDLGKRVLLVDGDASGDLTNGLGYDPETEPIAARPASRHNPIRIPGQNIYEVAITRQRPVEECILQTEYGVDLLAANEDLAAADLKLLTEFQQNRRDYRIALRAALAPVRDEYDYILIDCPPTLGVWTINALAAADGVIVPAAANYRAWRALSRLMDSIDLARGQFNQNLRVLGILPTLYDARTNHGKEVLASIEADYGNVTKVFEPVRVSVRYAESPLAGTPAMRYAPDIAEPYQAVAETLVKMMKEAGMK